MAKKVINSYYEFDPVLGTVSVLGYHKLSDFFLITNVTTNTIIYNFSISFEILVRHKIEY